MARTRKPTGSLEDHYRKPAAPPLVILSDINPAWQYACCQPEVIGAPAPGTPADQPTRRASRC